MQSTNLERDGVVGSPALQQLLELVRGGAGADPVQRQRVEHAAWWEG